LLFSPPLFQIKQKANILIFRVENNNISDTGIFIDNQAKGISKPQKRPSKLVSLEPRMFFIRTVSKSYTTATADVF
jgi:hypothetical protein